MPALSESDEDLVPPFSDVIELTSSLVDVWRRSDGAVLGPFWGHVDKESSKSGVGLVPPFTHGRQWRSRRCSFSRLRSSCGELIRSSMLLGCFWHLCLTQVPGAGFIQHGVA